MSAPDFTTTLIVDNTPEEAFNAITNVRGWWSEEIEGGTAKLNDEFDYHYLDVHKCRMKLIEVIPNKKVVWSVLSNYFKFTKDTTEWTGTTIVFDIIEKDGKTLVRLTHQGLVHNMNVLTSVQMLGLNTYRKALVILLPPELVSQTGPTSRRRRMKSD